MLVNGVNKDDGEGPSKSTQKPPTTCEAAQHMEPLRKKDKSLKQKVRVGDDMEHP